MKNLLISIIVATVALPAVAAQYASPRRGVLRMVFFLLAFVLVYVAYATLVHATYVLPEN